MKSQTHQKVDYTPSIEKSIDNFSEKLATESKEKGRTIGKNSPPSAEMEIINMPNVKYILKTVIQFFYELAGFIDDTLQQNFTKYHQILKEYRDDNILHSLFLRKAEIAKLLTKTLNEIAFNITVGIADVQTEIDRLQNKIKTDTIQLEELHYKNVAWKIFFAFLLIIGILGSEVFVNQKSFLFLKGENFMTSMFIAIGISFTTFLIGFAIARIIQHKTLTDTKKIVFAILITIVALGVYYGVAELRVSMLETMKTATGRNSFVISKLTLMMINFGFFVSLVIVKLFLYPSPAIFEENAKFNALKKKIKLAKKKITKLRQEIKGSNKTISKDQEKAKKKYEAEIKAIEKELQAKHEQLKTFQINFNRALATGIKLRAELNALAQKCIGIFITEINLFRSDGVILEMPLGDIEPIENTFVEYDFIDDTEITELFNETSNINLFND